MKTQMALVVLCAWSVSSAVGQDFEIEMVNRPTRLAPFIITLYQDSHAEYVESHIWQYEDNLGTAFLTIKIDEGQTVDALIDMLNKQLNYTQGIDLQRCYLLVIGDEDFYERFEGVDTQGFLAGRYFMSSELVADDPKDSRGGSIYSKSVKQVVSTLSEDYLWQVHLAKIEAENVSDLNQNSIEWGMHFRMNGVLSSYQGVETTIRPFFLTYTLGAYYRWGRNWQSLIDFTIGPNLPTQSRIQRELQGAGDPNEEVEIDIHAHIFWSVSLDTRYLFETKHDKINPYVGFHIGYSSMDATEQTIEINPNAIGGLGRPEGFDSDDFESLRSPSAGLSTGLQLFLNPKLVADFGLKWNRGINPNQLVEPYFNNFSLTLGLGFRFTGKKVLFYDYLVQGN